MHLELNNLFLEQVTFDLLGNLGGLSVHAGLEKGLRMVELVLFHVWEELGQLVIVVRCLLVVLHVEVAVGKEGQGGTVTWTEL